MLTRPFIFLDSRLIIKSGKSKPWEVDIRFDLWARPLMVDNVPPALIPYKRRLNPRNLHSSVYRSSDFESLNSPLVFAPLPGELKSLTTSNTMGLNT